MPSTPSMKGLAIAAVLAAGAVARSSPITYVFEFDTSGTLNGAPFPLSRVVVTFEADTLNIMPPVLPTLSWTVPAPAHIAVDGVGSGLASGGFLVFSEVDFVPLAGFQDSSTPLNWTVIGHSAFSGYHLNVALGPIVTGVAIFTFNGVPTAFGTLTLAAPTQITFEAIVCYPDCNGAGGLTIADFGCFQTRFVAGDPYADCNGVGGLTIADFGCFQTRFVAGCP